jgi:hypothetical protein
VTTINGESRLDEAFGVAVDAAGRIVIVGTTGITYPCGGATCGGADMFLARYLDDGTLDGLLAPRVDKCDAPAHEEHPPPPLPVDVFAQEGGTADGANEIAEGGHGNDKADCFDGQQREQCHHIDREQCESKPDPRETDDASEHLHERGQVKVGYLTDGLHGASEAQLTARAGDDDYYE